MKPKLLQNVYKNYIHRNSACPQRVSPERPGDQCVGTMVSWDGGIQALWSGDGMSQGSQMVLSWGLSLRDGDLSSHPGTTSQEGDWQRWAGDLGHSGLRAFGALIPSWSHAGTSSGAGFQGILAPKKPHGTVQIVGHTEELRGGQDSAQACFLLARSCPEHGGRTTS